MVAFGGKLLLAMYGSHSGASRVSAVWRLSAFWRVRYRRFHCNCNLCNVSLTVLFVILTKNASFRTYNLLFSRQCMCRKN